MVFLTLRAAWLRRQRAKKQLTAAKNNVKNANKQYNTVKKINKALPPISSSRNYGVMRMVRVKHGNYANNVGMGNNAYNTLKTTHKYNWNKGYWVRKN
jgi:hypothetical protein